MKDVKQIETKEKTGINKRTIILVLIAIILIIALSIFIYLYNTNTSKIKRYLTKQEYECTKVECTKIKDTYKYAVTIEDQSLTASSDNYIIKINDDEVLLMKRSDKSTCSYTKDNFNKTSLIDETYTYTVYCQEHIDEINEIIADYQTIIKEAKIKM